MSQDFCFLICLLQAQGVLQTGPQTHCTQSSYISSSQNSEKCLLCWLQKVRHKERDPEFLCPWGISSRDLNRSSDLETQEACDWASVLMTSFMGVLEPCTILLKRDRIQRIQVLSDWIGDLVSLSFEIPQHFFLEGMGQTMFGLGRLCP